MKPLLSLLLLVSSSHLAAAPAYLEVTGGNTAGLPIAILPFQQAGQTGLDEIIHADLAKSGHFYALPRTQVLAGPYQSAQQHMSYWQRRGIEHLVTGTITPRSGGFYDVEVKLLDLYQHLDKSKTANLLFAKKFTRISTKSMRALGHHIADQVFEKLTGIAGIFSTRIAYITKQYQGNTLQESCLVIADADGYAPQVVYRSKAPLMSPAWSPDGKKLAFVSFEHEHPQITILTVSHGTVERLPKFRGINGAPAWSPDGKQLAVVLSKDGSPKIYTYDLSLRRFRKITQGRFFDTEPTWAPDGKSLYFTSNRGGTPQIYNVTLASSRVQRVTFQGTYNAGSAVTPDGRYLAMMHRNKHGLSGIALLELQSNKLTWLAQEEADESPSIAPNGTMVLYESSTNGQKILRAVSLDGRFKFNLPIATARVQQPVWSPFLS